MARRLAPLLLAACLLAPGAARADLSANDKLYDAFLQFAALLEAVASECTVGEYPHSQAFRDELGIYPKVDRLLVAEGLIDAGPGGAQSGYSPVDRSFVVEQMSVRFCAQFGCDGFFPDCLAYAARYRELPIVAEDWTPEDGLGSFVTPDQEATLRAIKADFEAERIDRDAATDRVTEMVWELAE